MFASNSLYGVVLISHFLPGRLFAAETFVIDETSCSCVLEAKRIFAGNLKSGVTTTAGAQCHEAPMG